VLLYEEKNTIVKVYTSSMLFSANSVLSSHFACISLCNSLQFNLYFGAHLQTLQ